MSQSQGLTPRELLFEARLEREDELLERLLATFAHGDLPVDAWARLHVAAARDRRVSELAFAYEKVTRTPFFGTLPVTVQAEFRFQAGIFFGEVVNDENEAVRAFEAVIATFPAHGPAFERLVFLLAKQGNSKRLGEVHAALARELPPEERSQFFQAAAEYFEQVPGCEAEVVEMYRALVELNPTDEAARTALESRMVAGNRVRELVRSLEQSLATEASQGSATTATSTLSRLVDLHANHLREPERALPHVEGLLALDPGSAIGREVATRLLVVKGLAARAASALAKAHEAVGDFAEAARHLALEVDHTRGPKRKELLHRLGVMKMDALTDYPGAFEHLEAALLLDPTNDDVRERYVSLARELGREAVAAKAMLKVTPGVKDPVLRTRLTADTGELLLASGDTKRARAMFATVFTTAEADVTAMLVASHALADIFWQEKDYRGLADALTRIADVEPEEERRVQVLEQLADLADATLGDTPRAIDAWQKLLATSSRPKALEALERLYDAAKDKVGLARVLEERAIDEPEPTKARELFVRAAESLAAAGDEARATATWLAIRERFGVARDVTRALAAAYEKKKDWSKLAETLAADADLAPGSERGGIQSRLGVLYADRLSNPETAIRAFAASLEVSPDDKAARDGLVKLLGHATAGFLAADALERSVRAEDDVPLLGRLLEVKAERGTEPAARLAAFAERLELLEAEPKDRAKAIDWAGRALAVAVELGIDVPTWIVAVDRVIGPTGDAKKRATAFAKALGERPVTDEIMATLAQRSGDAWARAGDANLAIAAFKKVLAFDPSRRELEERIDELALVNASPDERIKVLRAAIASGRAENRRAEQLLTIADIERGPLGKPEDALRTLGELWETEPTHEGAHALALEILRARGDTASEFGEFRRFVGVAKGPEKRAAELAWLAVAFEKDVKAEGYALAERLLADAGTSPEDLDAIDAVAARANDVDLGRKVLYRRIGETAAPLDQAALFERVAEMELDVAKDAKAAHDAFAKSAELAESVGEDALARARYRRALAAQPGERGTLGKVILLSEAAKDHAALPELYAALLNQKKTDAERLPIFVRLATTLAEDLGRASQALAPMARAFSIAPDDPDVLARFERVARLASAPSFFADAIDECLGMSNSFKKEVVWDLSWAKARVLAADESLADAAVDTLKALLADPDLDDARARPAMDTLDSLLATMPDGPARTETERGLFERRVERAAPEDRVAILGAWARVEETRFGDPKRALALHARILEQDPENDDALDARHRLAVAEGDVGAAIDALVVRRQKSDGEARRVLGLELATLLTGRDERPDLALDAISEVLEAVPFDARALALAMKFVATRASSDRAVDVVEKALDGIEDVAIRATTLDGLLAHAVHADPARRREWFERLVALHDGAQDEAKAFEVALRALVENPKDESLWERAESLARKLGRPGDLATAYASVLEKLPPDDASSRIGERAIAFHEEWFDDVAGTVRILESILTGNPRATWAFERLKLVYDHDEKWTELFALYDRVLAVLPEPERAPLLEEVAQIAKDFAGDMDRAIRYLEELHRMDPKGSKVSSALERLYERQKKHRALIDLLASRIPDATEREAQEIRARLVYLWLDQLKDPGAALLVVEEMMIHRAAGDGGTASQASVDFPTLLERILLEAPQFSEIRASLLPAADGSGANKKPPLVRQRVAALLKEQYGEKGREADLVRVLEIELEVVKNAKERIRRHHAIAELYEALGNEAAAFDHRLALVVLEPDAREERVKLAALADRTGKQKRHAEVLIEGAEASADEAVTAELLYEAARVKKEALGDDVAATELLLRVLAIEGAARNVRLEAARLAAPLLAADDKKRERLDVLEQLSALESSPADVRALLGEVAKLASGIGEQERAVIAWETRIENDPEDEEALDGLVVLHEASREWRALFRDLERRAEIGSREAELRRRDRVAAVTLLDTKLDEPGRAIELWLAIEKEFGATDDSGDALRGLYARTGDADALAELLGRECGRTTVPERLAVLHAELGEVFRARLGKTKAALVEYEKSLESDPSNLVAVRGLEALLVDPKCHDTAVEILTSARRRAGDHAAFVDLTSERISIAASDAAKVAVYLEAADVAEGPLRDPARAFALAGEAFLVAPGESVVYERLRALAEKNGDFGTYATLHRTALASLGKKKGADKNLALSLRARLGDALENRLSDFVGALEVYEEIQKSHPKDAAAAVAALRVAARAGSWDSVARVFVAFAVRAKGVDAELVDAVERHAESEPQWLALTTAMAKEIADLPSVGKDLVRDLESQVATWHRDRRSDIEAAEAAYGRALACDPENRSILSNLSVLQRRGRGRPLVETLRRLSRTTGGDLGLLQEAGDIAYEAVDDRSLARALARETLDIASERFRGGTDGPPTSGDALPPEHYVTWAENRLVAIFEESGEEDAIVDLLLECAALPFPVDATRAMRHQAAAIAADRTFDPERATALYRALFDEDASDREAARRLSALYEQSGAEDAKIDLRRRQIPTAFDVDERLELRLDLARLLAKNDRTDAAIDVLEENLAESPRHGATVSALADALTDEEDHARLVRLHTSQAEAAEGAGEKSVAADFWEKAAGVASSRLADRDLAIRNLERVVALEKRPAAFETLANLLLAKNDHARAARALAELLEVTSAATRGAVAERLADAHLAEGARGDARLVLERELAKAPSEDSLRARLATLYREDGAWAELAGVLAEGALRTNDKAERLASLFEASALYLERANLPDRAIPLLEQAIDLDPENATSKLTLARALGTAGRVDEARTLLRASIDAFGTRKPKERAPVHHQLAELELSAGDRARALVELDTATRIDPTNPRILRTLADLAREDGQLDRAERSYRALLAVLRKETDSVATTGMARSEVLYVLAKIAAAQGASARADELTESAVETAESSGTEAKVLEKALEKDGRFDTIARVLESRVKGETDPKIGAALRSDVARLFETRLGRSADALVRMLEAIELDPSEPARFDFAKELAGRLGALDTYTKRLEEAATRLEKTASPDVLALLYLRIARVCETDRNDPKTARGLYERALGQSRMPTARDGKVAAEVRYRLASLVFAHEKPDAFESARAILQEAVLLSPDWELAEAVISSALAKAPKDKGLVDLLEQVGRSSGKNDVLLAALVKRFELGAGDGVRLREAVALAKEADASQVAENLLALAAEGTVVGLETDVVAWAMDTMAEIRRADFDLEGFVGWKKKAAGLVDETRARALLLEVAVAAERELFDFAEAARTYESLLAKNPKDEEVQEALASVYERSNEFKSLAELLARAADVADTRERKSALRFRRVKVLLDRLGAGDEVTEPLLELVREDPTQVEASILLADRLERLGRNQELSDILATQFEAAKARDDRVGAASIAARRGSLLESVDAEQARALYEEGLALDPENVDLLRVLVALLRESGAADVRLSFLDRLLARESGPWAESVALEADELARAGGDPDRALGFVERGFAAHPTSDVLRQTLESRYREAKNFDKLAELYVADARSRESRSAKVARLGEAMGVYRDELGDPARAKSVLEEILALTDPTADARASLLVDRATLSMLLGDFDGSLADLEAAGSSTSMDRRVIRERTGELVAKARESGASDLERRAALSLASEFRRVQDDGAARELLAELAAAHPKDKDVLRALAKLEEDSGALPLASATYRRLVALEDDPVRVVETALLLADVCERGGVPDDARGGLERARSVAPDDETLRTRLESLYERVGAYAELAALHVDEASRAKDVAGRFAKLLRAGSIFLVDLGDFESALGPLEEANRLRPADYECSALFADALVGVGQSDRAFEMLSAVVAAQKNRRVRELSPVYHRLARLAEDRGDAERQRAWLSLGLDMDAQNGLIASELAEVAMAAEDWDLANKALRAITMMKTVAPIGKGHAYQYLGEIAERQGDPKKAVLLLRRALDEDPSLEQARALLTQIQG
ncbi:MAG: tetratricopeptide repeat protein [Polyangiaceae bacterium]